MSSFIKLNRDFFSTEHWKEKRVFSKAEAYIDYDRPSLLLKFAKESFISAIESKEKFWLENPIKIIERGEDTEHNRVLNQNKWQEAEEKTFKNPLIFVKK